MSLSLHSSPHVHTTHSVSRTMLMVLLALVPGVLAHLYFFGWGLLINMSLAILAALGAEAIMLRLRRRPLWPFLSDGSAVVTAVLLALALPPFAPWWLSVLGAVFALVVAKHLYGGLGYNPFNPAMIGYAMLLIAFPLEMTQWLPAGTHGLGFIDNLNYSFLGQLPLNQSLDAISAATPLDGIKTQLALNNTLSEIYQANGSLFGSLGGAGWEWVNLMFLLGGALLIYIRVINWHIPVAFLLTLYLLSGVFHLSDPDTFVTPMFHLFSGATMLCAFFIATDPVTAPASNKGRIIYGIGIGLLVYIIRSWGGYPDAVAFAVLLMNMTVATIDYYTKPRVFGQGNYPGKD